MSILTLASDAAICCMAFLEDIDLLCLSETSKNFYSLSNHPDLWKFFLRHKLNIIDDVSLPPGMNGMVNMSHKDQYMSWKRSFSGYNLHEVGIVHSWWSRFEAWCSQRAPQVLQTLAAPANEETLQDVESDLDLVLPTTLRLLYRFHDGQNLEGKSAALGMFGGTLFYDMLTCMRFSGTSELFKLPITIETSDDYGVHATSQTYPIEKAVGFGVYTTQGAINKVYAVCDHPTVSGDSLVCVNADGGDCFLPCSPLDPNLFPDQKSGGVMAWFNEYLRRLEEGIYECEPIDLTTPHRGPPNPRIPSMISHFPLKPLHNSRPVTQSENDIDGPNSVNFGASVAVTDGVEVTACPAFIPDRSEPGRHGYFWYYSIRLRLLRDHPSRPKALTQCQLLSRHWKIYDPGEGTQSVDGEAVVGLYPLLGINYSQPADEYPGNLPFAYQSGSSSSAVPGKFEGHMKFVYGTKDQPSGPQFNVYLGTFTLGVPDFIY